MKKNIIIILFSVFIIFLLFNNGEETKNETKIIYKTKTITLKGRTDTIFVSNPKPYKVTEYILDTSLNDSIKVLNELINLAKTREYKKTYSDSIISFNIYTKVVGRLDSLNVNYNLKPRKIKYIETHKETLKKPKFSLYYGFGASNNYTLNTSLGFENSKGNYFGVSVNTNGFYGLNYRKRFFTKY